MIFRTPFWQELADARYRDTGFFHAARAKFPTFWTAVPAQAPMLTAWVGGPRAARLSSECDFAAMVGLALESLEQLFGKNEAIRTQLVAAYLHDWQRDRFARGAYSYVTVGGGKASPTPLELCRGHIVLRRQGDPPKCCGYRFRCSGIRRTCRSGNHRRRVGPGAWLGEKRYRMSASIVYSQCRARHT